MSQRNRSGVTTTAMSAAAFAIALSAASAPSYAFQFNSGDLEGSLDTTVSYGASWRVEDRDESIIGLPNGGTANSVNGDDGNLNYDKGLISNAFKITSELSLNYQNYGAFIRGSAFYDIENQDGDRDRTELSDEALELVGSDARLLDAYAYINFDVGDMPAQIRVGEQVLSWGESTFIQNSINTINHVDVSAIRLPGAELREALLPDGLVWGSISLDDQVSFEGFVQYDWDQTDPDPTGSYFSANDFAVAGGERVQLGFGGAPEGPFLGVPRAESIPGDNDGQFGVALRIFAPELNDTEFGVYYINYNSRLPLISGRTGTLAGALAAGPAGTAAGQAAAAAVYANAGVAPGTDAGVDALAASTASATGTAVGQDTYSRTARYFTEYPDDITLFGLSFNTELLGSGVALQGEVSHRKDVPLQVDDVELLFAALGPINAGLAGFNQIGDYTGQFETYIPGYIRRDVTQVQMTATKAFGPTFGADQLVMVGEAGVTHVHSMPDKSNLRLESPGTYISGNAALAGAHGPAAGEVEDAENFADATSWGYRVAGRLTYNNAVGALNLSPSLAFQHDVNGNSPGPGGNFLQGRKAITLGLAGDYQNKYSFDLTYTRFSGASRYNLLTDRDFVAFNVKYSF